MNRVKFLWIISILILNQQSFAQLLDNFSDNEFSSNPPWTGDQTKFVVNSGKLKLQAPAVAETAYLSSPSQALHNASWEFYLQMDFNPSSSNFAKIYLASDQPNLNQSLNGYFIKAGNTAREISLYRQGGTVETKIIDGVDDRLNISFVKVKIKVTRSAAGTWQLFTDVGPTGTYSLEGSATDAIYTVSSYFGIQCIYTATRSDKFWFDDFVVTGVPVPDIMPPFVQTATAEDRQQIDVLFSELLDPVSAQDIRNFFLVGVGNPTKILLSDDQKTLQLNFDFIFVNGFTYTLQIVKVKDLSGNEMAPVWVSILFFQPVKSKPKDIIITEIFPDPLPQIGLPTAEFIEIYNRSQNPFNLGGWKLADGNSVGILPSQIILPGEYRIVTASSTISFFNSYGTVLGVINFPTLNNDQDNIILKNDEDRTIDSVSYNIEWYKDDDKQMGGWSLELIDPGNPCGEEENWTVSESPSGGTPGKQNSVFANKPDFTGPVLLSVFPEQPLKISMTFNEKLDPSSLETKNFVMQPLGTISSVSFSDHTLRTLMVELERGLSVRTPYSIEVDGVRDCNGNLMLKNSFHFGLPEEADSLDVIVNEILFNPRPGGVDFVEVYNASPKFLNIRRWKLGNNLKGIVNGAPLFSENKLLAPNSFAVFTSDPFIVKSQYPQSQEQYLYKTVIPGLPDDEGSVAIATDSGKILDALNYHKAWHSEFVKNEEGVSLERISWKGATNEKNNWTSASANAGFATPGFQNSQGRGATESAENVSVVPDVFSPESGAGEFVQIQYHFDQGGWVANVRIYDSQGRPLKTLASSETMSSEGFFRWDGDRDDGSKARMGYYLVWFEAYSAAGEVKTFRKRVIISER